MTIAVFDIDGVVADVRHRLHHLDRRPKDWDGFFRTAATDPPLSPGTALVHELAVEHEIVWLTGRPSWMRSLTADWLTAHGLPGSELLMRSGGDRRPARLMKLAALRSLAARGIHAFVDDDPDVISAAVAAGYPAVLAEWVPRDDPGIDSLHEAQERLGRS